MIPRFLDTLCEQIGDADTNIEFQIKLSAMTIHNEKIIDILNRKALLFTISPEQRLSDKRGQTEGNICEQSKCPLHRKSEHNNLGSRRLLLEPN